MPLRTVRELHEATSICQLFQDTVARHPDRIALCAFGGEPITWRESATRVRRIAAGLAAMGVRRGDTVALMPTNRPEFNLVDAAAQPLGAVPFSVYNTCSAEQIEYVEVLPVHWMPGGDELTPTAKPRRKPIAEKYADVIDRIYDQARKS